jgi:membrane-bound serine protease (ClpP class)
MKRVYFCLLVLLLIITSGGLVKASTGLVYKIPITGEIDPGLVKVVERSIDEAEEAGADLIIFEIDTYGGYVDSAIKIRDMLLESAIPSYTYVKGRAWSAGALITLAGNKVAMKPGSSIGAAETRPNEEKYISALRKEFKSTAEVRGKNPDIAAAMVDADIEIDGLITSGKLLTLTANEALNHGITDIVVDDINGIFDHEDFKPARIVSIEMTTAEKAARFIIKPEVSTILITVGIIALLIETFMIGFGVSGVIGLLSLGVVFSSHVFYGGASWGLVILFILGLVLMLLEVFVIPGFGLAGIAGLVALLASIYLLFPTTEIALSAIALIMLFALLAIGVLIKLFGISPLWKRISLNESQTTEAGYIASETRKELLGKKARALTPLRPAGIAEIDGYRIDVVSEGGFIEKGQAVEIIKVSGNRIVVKKYQEGDE